MRRARILALALLLADPAFAQIALDGSLGPAGPLLPDATGDIEVPQAVGRLEGGNLFHSFSELSVARGQSATFTATDGGIERVVARVTGHTRSQIDGALRSHVPGADLYLFNPAGVVFGDGASLDVDGSLHLSTADALRLADGGVLHADPGRASVLSRAPPSAWEFMGPSAASIRIEGSRLEVGPRRTLSFVGGPIEVSGRSGGPFGEPVLVAPGGRIELVASGAAGVVQLGPDGPDASGVESLADVSISDNAQLSTAGSRSGTVQIRARDLHIEEAFVYSDSLGAEAPLPLAIDVEARGDVLITGPAELLAELDGSADTGRLRIAARRLEMTGSGALIGSWLSEGSGRGGDIEVDVSELHMRSGAQIFVESNGPGRAGHLYITADQIDLAGLNTLVGAETRARGQQPGGSFADDVSVSVRAEDAALLDGAQIFSITRSAADGTDIEIEVGTLHISGLAIDSGGRIVPAGIVSNEEPAQIPQAQRTWRVGTRGSVLVRARDSIEIENGGVIQAGSPVREAGDAGERAGSVRVEAPRIALRGSQATASGNFQSGISSIAAFRDAGDLEVRAEELLILDGASISATTEGPGGSGSVLVHAERIHIAGKDERDKEAGIFAQSLVAAGADSSAAAVGGPGGDIELSVQDLEVSDGGVIRVSTETAGNGGRLAINSGANADPEWSRSASIRMSDGQIDSRAFPLSTGDGGSIAISARDLLIEHGSQIAASNLGTGDAGSIDIVLQDSLRMSSSEITTEAVDGFGGNVNITATRLLDLLDSRIETSVRGVTGDGGNIEIDPRLVVLNRSSILATAVGGDGGDITIVADELLSSADSVIDASSELGVDGDIVIRSPADELIEGIAPLQADLLGASDLLRRGCAAQRSPSGSLTVAPRVVRIGPDGVLEDEADTGREHCEAR